MNIISDGSDFYVRNLAKDGDHLQLKGLSHLTWEDGGLRFKDTDDNYGIISRKPFNTIFMLVKTISTPFYCILYDCRGRDTSKRFAYYCATENGIAYNERGATTYINGNLNTTIKCNQLKDKTHLIHSTIASNNLNSSANYMTIGAQSNDTSLFHCNMILYKFFGIDKVMTESEMRNFISDMGLLDTVSPL